jgi:predicted MFS family arabinose efflux permease
MASKITFRDVLSMGEFRAMWLADCLSLLGDQCARVALAVLVFDRTDSAALTGLVYALTYIPVVVGSLALSRFADHRSRRSVMITIDTCRALIVAAMVIPRVSLIALCILVTVMSFLGGPYKAAQLALLREVLDAGQYPVGLALRQITNQAGQLAGFALGGIVSASASPQLCLGIDAVTFGAAACLVQCFVRIRPAAGSGSEHSSIISGTKTVWDDPRRRAILLTTLLGFFYIVSDGLAAPYVAQLGYGSAMVGLVLASSGVGAVLGVSLFLRLVPLHRRPIAFPISCLTAGLPLILVLVNAGIYVAFLLFAMVGAIWSVQVLMASSYLAELLPDRHRAQGMGLGGSMNLTASGLGIALAGLIGQAMSPAIAIGLSGAASVLAAVLPSMIWLRSVRGCHTAAPGGESGIRQAIILPVGESTGSSTSEPEGVRLDRAA